MTKTKRIHLIAPAALLAIAASAPAQTLPKAGSIEFHTGWKFTGTVVNVADKHVQGHGSVSGVTFNNKGSGPLHLGPANCFDTFFVAEGKGRAKGFCTFSDPDGDRIFTDYAGETVPEGGGDGTNQIVGGTGKYEGISGSGPWRCRIVGSNGELQCAQRLDYKLPRCAWHARRGHTDGRREEGGGSGRPSPSRSGWSLRRRPSACIRGCGRPVYDRTGIQPQPARTCPYSPRPATAWMSILRWSARSRRATSFSMARSSPWAVQAGRTS